MSSALRRPAPRSWFHVYVAALGVLAGGVCAAALTGWDGLHGRPGMFWLLAAFVLIGELLPVQIPRGTHFEWLTMSSAFALAILLEFGAAPAVLVYAGACVIADVVNRTEPLKVGLNAAHYVVSLGTAAGVLALVASGPPTPVAGAELPGVLLAAVAFFVVDIALLAIAAAILDLRPLRAYVRRDLLFDAWTSGFLISLAPTVVAVAEVSLWLVPLLFCPVLAIYVGGRQAVSNAHRALHDELTGLPNRTLLYRRLDEAVEVAGDRGGAAYVLMINLNDFRSVNDTLGHHHGDTLLSRVSSRLSDGLRETETLARVGGDEFALIGAAGDQDEAELTAKRIADTLAAPFEIGGIGLEVRPTVGIACFPEHGLRARELVQHADVALHGAKQHRTLYEVYSADRDNSSVDQLRLAGQLRHGIEAGELVLHYQPKLDLSDGTVRSVEALVRWQHPELGLLGPQAFVPLAEHTGLIEALTTTVLDLALAQTAAWRREGLEIRTAVNLSAPSLLDTGLSARVEAALTKWDLPPSALQLELTESRIVADAEAARQVLDKLRAIGVGCAIDDFGTGYSSLAQLQQLHVDEIKIDRSFVTNMDTSRDDETIVRSTIELGRNLGLRVTAEGVEGAAVCQRLTELGCDHAQGYYIGHPVPGDVCFRRSDGASSWTVARG